MPSSRTFGIVILLLLLSTCVQGQGASSKTTTTGEVSGVVVIDGGKPASHYIVNVIGASLSSTRQTQVQTNDEGAFAVYGLKLGSYVIEPYLEGANSRYPGGTSSFYNPDPVRVELTEAVKSKQITVNLGPPNRILSGTVASSYTGAALIATIRIELPDDPDRFIEFSTNRRGEFRVLIPAKTKLVLKATAFGHLANQQELGPIAAENDPRIEIKLR